MIDLVPEAAVAFIYLAPGVYGNANFYYYRAFNVQGPLDGSGNCMSPSAVTIEGDGDVVTSQDHAILGLTCVTLAATSVGATGLYCRQFSITDLVSVAFSSFPGGTDVSCTDQGQVSFSGYTWLNDSAVVFLSLIDSHADIGSWFLTASGLSFAVFCEVQFQSTANWSNAVMTGPGGGPATAGQQWYLSGGEMYLPSGGYVLPGNVAGNGTVAGMRVSAY